MGSNRTTRSKGVARSWVKAKPQSLLRSARASRKQVSYEDDESSDEEYYGEDENNDVSVVCHSSTPQPRTTQARPGDELYVAQDSAGGLLFKSLPVEVHQNIIDYLPTDRDVAIYKRLSKSAQSAVSSSVWRRRFEGVFDMIDGLKADILADKYKKRREFFKKWVIFDIKKLGGVVPREVREKQWHYQKECLSRLTDLIFESKAYKTTDEKGNDVMVDLNMQFLRELTCERRAHNVGNYLDILDALFEDDYTLQPRGAIEAVPKNNTIMMIQLCLSSIILHPIYCNTKVSHFDISQDNVYGTEAKIPLFKGPNKSIINLSLLLHTVNFFKFHFKAGIGEGLLCDVYKGLEQDQYPQTWLGHIKSGTYELGSHWKGTYSWLDDKDLMRMRRWKSQGEIYSDAVDDEESFLDMTFFFDNDKFPTKEWPVGFDRILNSDPYSGLNRVVEVDEPKRVSPRKKSRKPSKEFSRPEIKQFLGSSRGVKNGQIFGRVHALNRQHDFHGWQRVTIMKFFANVAGEYDANQVWAYEGVVLPGGRMILGRWRDARADPAIPDKTVSGPFIFWNIDRSTVEPPIEADEALEFAKTIQDPLLTGF